MVAARRQQAAAMRNWENIGSVRDNGGVGSLGGGGEGEDLDQNMEGWCCSDGLLLFPFRKEKWKSCFQ